MHTIIYKTAVYNIDMGGGREEEREKVLQIHLQLGSLVSCNVSDESTAGAKPILTSE